MRATHQTIHAPPSSPALSAHAGNGVSPQRGGVDGLVDCPACMSQWHPKAFRSCPHCYWLKTGRQMGCRL